jgi:cytochrome c biogenesis protein CcdA
VLRKFHGHVDIPVKKDARGNARMLVLVLVGLVAGVITSLSPCVLPVLPNTTTPVAERSRRPYGVVAGLILSFSVAGFSAAATSRPALPANLLRMQAPAPV